MPRELDGRGRLLLQMGEPLSQRRHADRNQPGSPDQGAAERLLLFALAEAISICASFNRAQPRA